MGQNWSSRRFASARSTLVSKSRALKINKNRFKATHAPPPALVLYDIRQLPTFANPPVRQSLCF